MDKIQQLFINNYRIYDPSAVSEFYSNETVNIKPDLSGSRYMSKRIYGFIRNRLHYKIERDYIFDNTRVSICIYCINKSFSFSTLFNILNYYIFVLNKLNHKPVFKLILYLTNLKKLFPQNPEQVLNEDNVNSGVTIFNDNEKSIIIYRKEEIYKVLLHEMIHFYEIDFHNYDTLYDKYFITKYGIQVNQPYKNRNNPLALYESYTDTVACYGHIITNVLFKNDKNLSDNALLSIIKETLEKEIKHYKLQASKVLKFSNLREDTHCFSYYIAKACIFSNFNKFIEFVEHNGIKLNTHEKQRRFLELLKELMDDQNFWKDLKKIRTRKIVLSGLKMTKLKW
jgi:hypothetical protein